jgi:hypothetical protein
MKHHGVLPLFFLLPALGLFAQTAAELDRLLETEAVSAGTAARFVLGAAGLVPEGLSGAAAEEAAFRAARERGWLRREAEEALSLKETAFLVMNAFDIPGGALYSLTRSPRYAYRECIHRKLIQGRADPDSAVSGLRLLRIIGRTLDHTNENAEAEASPAGTYR